MVAVAACGSPPRPAAGTPAGIPVAVTLIRADVVDIPAIFDAGGTVRATFVAAISSRVLAPVTTVRVRPGDRVRRGQVLVELDGRELAANQARAAAASTASENSVRAAEADVLAAEADLAHARAIRDRIVTLFEQRSATAQERDDAAAAFSSAEAHLAGARARVAETNAVFDAARAAADASTIAASYASITAPFDGVVSARHIDPGVIAMPGSPLLTVEDASALQLDVRVDEARVPAIALRQRMRVRLDDSSGAAAIAGMVTEVARVDPESHSFDVKIDLATDARLRPGLYGRAEFEGPPRQAIVVPATAVLRRGQLAFVFTVSADGTARMRPVSLGQTTGTGIEIAAGLSAGESLIAAPPETLTDGARVRVEGRR